MAYCGKCNQEIKCPECDAPRRMRVRSPEYGIGELIGFYEYNKYPYHVLYYGDAQTYTKEEFEAIKI